jgi:hypothetical protein
MRPATTTTGMFAWLIRWSQSEVFSTLISILGPFEFFWPSLFFTRMDRGSSKLRQLFNNRSSRGPTAVATPSPPMTRWPNSIPYRDNSDLRSFTRFLPLVFPSVIALPKPRTRPRSGGSSLSTRLCTMEIVTGTCSVSKRRPGWLAVLAPSGCGALNSMQRFKVDGDSRS